MSRPKKNILVVEPNEIAMSLRAMLLETWGFAVVRAESAERALAMVGQAIPHPHPGCFDLVIAELQLAPVDGNELVRQVKEIQPSLPCLITSTIVGEFDRAIHADGFLPRGACDAVTLIGRVKLMVARKRGPMPSLRKVSSVEAHA